MADAEETPMSIDEALSADIVSQSDDAVAVSTVSESEVNAVATEAAVSKNFTTVDADGNEVHYVTMTQEEAEAAGVEDDEQVVTTSLQFDPANPSVLYTADGTLINQADLSPEEQALVQAALQQHLAEQEAEQQLALIEQNSAGESSIQVEQSTEAVTSETAVVSTQAQNIDAVVAPSVVETAASETQTTVSTATPSADEPIAVISSATTENQPTETSSPSTTASRMVQTFADSVRRQAEYKKAQDLLERAEPKSELPEGFRYEEKIVIRQGQPQVVKVPVRAPPPAKRPEIPAVLANLMPKIEIGKDGSQVIRIHQSQITADQLKSLQENPNVRLVFRPASSSRNRGSSASPYNFPPRKRGRPRKNYISASSPAVSRDIQGSPSKTNRYGRQVKIPYHQKDYLSTDIENGDLGDNSENSQRPPGQVYPVYQSRRGRPPGSLNKSTLERVYRRAPSFSRKMEQLREQELQHDEELTNARLSIVPQKPVLSSVELAISTRRKNRLRELLSACSEHEIMEVALPHLARVFSLWEFLIMKVEKNKMSRVYFADVYKEYEVLHRYISRLTERYKAALFDEKLAKTAANENGEADGALQTEKKKLLKVRCKLLAQSLGLEQDELEDAFITLLDAEELSPPPPAKQPQSKETTESKDKVELVDVNLSPENAHEATAPSLASAAEPSPATQDTSAQNGNTAEKEQPMDAEIQNDEAKIEKSDESVSASLESNPETATTEATESIEPATGGTQIIQIGTGDDKQFIEVPEGYTLIQTPDGLVMSQPGTTLSQGEDGTIYVTHEDGTTTTLDSQKAVALDAIDPMMAVDDQGQAN